ncbi:1284_t:CDS:2, partial [Paraglomus occultum]
MKEGLQTVDANFPKTLEGRVYHVGVKRGEVANRIITVGDHSRARALAKFLDQTPNPHIVRSERKFLTITGRYKGVPVSIIAIGMGFAMVDFFVREVRAVVDGELAIIRMGSCGTIGSPETGSMVVPDGAFVVTKNYTSAEEDEDDSVSSRYSLSKVYHADDQMHNLLKSELCKRFPKSEVYVGLDATCDSFYSSQGRMDVNFADYNSSIISYITTVYPRTQIMEMETAILYRLARASNNYPLKDKSKKHSIKAAAALMVYANRKNNDFVSPDRVNFLEKKAGEAVFEAIVKVNLDELHNEEGSVWSITDDTKNSTTYYKAHVTLQMEIIGLFVFYGWGFATS